MPRFPYYCYVCSSLRHAVPPRVPGALNIDPVAKSVPTAILEANSPIPPGPASPPVIEADTTGRVSGVWPPRTSLGMPSAKAAHSRRQGGRGPRRGLPVRGGSEVFGGVREDSKGLRPAGGDQGLILGHCVILWASLGCVYTNKIKW